MGLRDFERQGYGGGENLEPGPASRRPARKARRERPGAVLEQMIDVTPMLESDALVNGAHHLGQPVPRGEADERAARLRLIEPAIEIGKKIGNGVAGAG